MMFANRAAECRIRAFIKLKSTQTYQTDAKAPPSECELNEI